MRIRQIIFKGVRVTHKYQGQILLELVRKLTGQINILDVIRKEHTTTQEYTVNTYDSYIISIFIK